MTAVGLIGCGGMAQDVVAALRAADTAVRIVGALARPGHCERAGAKLCGVDIVEALDDLIARKPTVVAEVASQAAVAEHGARVLRSGIDCLVISIGALADAALFAQLKSAAREGNSRILLPAGAVGGIDAIAAMRLGGLTWCGIRRASRRSPGAARRRSGWSTSASSPSEPSSTRARAGERRCSIRRTPMSPPRGRAPG